MGILSKIKNVYHSVISKSQQNDIGMVDFTELDDNTLTEEQNLLSDINPDIRKWFIEQSKETSTSDATVQPKVINVQLATDNPTATQILTLLGMVRYSMEQSSKDSNKSFSIQLTISNRNGSPLLVGLGDTSIPSIPIVSNFEIGN
jgi:hypothetical protein